MLCEQLRQPVLAHRHAVRTAEPRIGAEVEVIRRNSSRVKLAEPIREGMRQVVIGSAPIDEHEVFRRGPTGSEGGRHETAGTCSGLDGGADVEFHERLGAGSAEGCRHPAQLRGLNFEWRRLRSQRDLLSIVCNRQPRERELSAKAVKEPEEGKGQHASPGCPGDGRAPIDGGLCRRSGRKLAGGDGHALAERDLRVHRFRGR
jgi:hypothetical protein